MAKCPTRPPCAIPYHSPPSTQCRHTTHHSAPSTSCTWHATSDPPSLLCTTVKAYRGHRSPPHDNPSSVCPLLEINRTKVSLILLMTSYLSPVIVVPSPHRIGWKCRRHFPSTVSSARACSPSDWWMSSHSPTTPRAEGVPRVVAGHHKPSSTIGNHRTDTKSTTPSTTHLSGELSPSSSCLAHHPSHTRARATGAGACHRPSCRCVPRHLRHAVRGDHPRCAWRTARAGQPGWLGH
jgi:hypothetical protein